MHPVPGVRYGSYVLRHREVLEWSCPIHVEPLPDYWDDDYDEIEFDFPVYGCTCDTRAKWRGTGVWKYVMESIFNQILRDFYLPSVLESLNNTVLLDALGAS